MTRIEYLSASVERLADFLELMQSDGLQAKGCSMDLLLPQTETGSWESWLAEEYPAEWDKGDQYCEISAMRTVVEEAARKRMEAENGN